MFLWSFIWLVTSSRGGRQGSCEGSDSTETSWDCRKYAQEEKSRPEEPVSHVEKAHHRVQSRPSNDITPEGLMKSEGTLTPAHWCFSLTLSAPAWHRCPEVPASAGAGRRPPVWR